MQNIIVDMKVLNLGNNLFRVSLSSNDLVEPLRIDLYNTMGQCLLHNREYPKNGIYSYDIDMSYAQLGMYIIRLGSDAYGKVRRIMLH